MDKLMPRVNAVPHVDGHVLRLTFADGVVADLDFAWVLERGGMFEPLHEVAFFKQVHVEPEFGTLEWPNGLDLDPDMLYHQATGAPLPGARPVRG